MRIQWNQFSGCWSEIRRMFFLSLLKKLTTDIQSPEQFDSAAQKNLNRNLFIILFLKITIIHWLMHAVTIKWESLHKNNYFRSFNFLVGAKSTFYSSNECYVHCWNIIYSVFQWNVLALKWIEYFSVRDSWDHKRSGTVYTLVYWPRLFKRWIALSCG